MGAAIAVSFGGGGFFVAQAVPGPSESTVVSVTPTRILDTRDPVNLGLVGPFTSPVSQKLQVTGSVPTPAGPQVVVPAGATGVLLNVTVVNPSAAGFVSIRPGDATGAPSTSSLNFAAGATVPNAVQVSLPTSGVNAGRIDITYDALGAAGPTTDLLVDVVGYTTSAGLQALVASVASKASSADLAALSATVTTRASSADVAALPGSFIQATGVVTPDGTKFGPLAQAGVYSVSRTTAGTYSLVLPASGCARFPAVVASIGINEADGSVAVGVGSCNVGAGQATYNVFTRNAAGVLTNRTWSFIAVAGTSRLPVAAAPLQAPGDEPACVRSDGAPCE